ncbi:MAG: lysophospholipid acyltransferase family protein [Alphaproteobacteria bacterium]
MPTSFIKKYIRYPFEALAAFLIFSIFKLMPISVASYCGSILLRVFGPLLKPNKTAKNNLKKAFPEKSDQEIKLILKKMWNNLGRSLGEFAHVPKIIKKGSGRIELIGIENVLSLKNDNKPGMFISAHLGNWETSIGACTSCDLLLHRIYRAANNPLVNKLVYSSGRGENFGELLPKGSKGARRALELLKKGEHLGILLDQKMNDGIECLFFGRPAMTAPAPAQFALKYDCPIVMAKSERLDGANFRITLYPPFYAENTGNRQEDIKKVTQKMNDIIESWIREKPEDWLWVHNRWKKN